MGRLGRRTEMSNENERSSGKGALKDILKPSPHPPGTALSDPKIKKRRRRAGYLNDGEWAPGYAPDANKKGKP